MEYTIVGNVVFCSVVCNCIGLGVADDSLEDVDTFVAGIVVINDELDDDGDDVDSGGPAVPSVADDLGDEVTDDEELVL